MAGSGGPPRAGERRVKNRGSLRPAGGQRAAGEAWALADTANPGDADLVVKVSIGFIPCTAFSLLSLSVSRREVYAAWPLTLAAALVFLIFSWKLRESHITEL
jgi:hypothetical protein